jgi:2-oxoglutarate ferredoxin oxidoreductase subunit delta
MRMGNDRPPRNAVPKGFIEILKEDCKGCGVCVDACPHSAIELSTDRNRRGLRYASQMTAESCTGCTLCYVQCPSSAIVVYKQVNPKRVGTKV